MMGRLDGKVTLITGSTQGVGEGIALKFAREGARVAVNGRSSDKGAVVLKKLQGIPAKDAIFLRADISVKEQAQKLIADVVQAFGRIDVLVNNAVVIDTWKRGEDETLDQSLHMVLPTSLYGALWLCQAAFPHMRAQGGGRIINFGSTSSTFGNRYSTAYNVSKEAIHGITRTLAQEWGRYNITVNTLMPAASSPGHQRIQDSTADLVQNDPALQEQARLFELTRALQPFIIGSAEDSVAPAAVGLASDSGRFITGQTIFADGGIHLWGLNQHMTVPGQIYQSSPTRA